MATNPKPAPFCHVEIRVRDLARARAFYGKLLGWSFRAASRSFEWIDTGAAPDGSLLEVDDDRATGVVCFVDVGSLAAAVQRGVDAGGRLLHGPRDEPGHGSYAILADPDGNRIGLWQRSIGADDVST